MLVLMSLLLLLLHIPTFIHLHHDRRSPHRILPLSSQENDPPTPSSPGGDEENEEPLEGNAVPTAFAYAFGEERIRNGAKIWVRILDRCLKIVASGFFLAGCLAYLNPGVLMER
ncbi:hypothetical protein HDV00_007211 [Rhizophlyctis rosea]|nr:hypothetical protein HDV00_007211 [Rhizophlyctis rosea]